MPILISIGYGVPRSTGRHTNLHTNYDLLVILLVKKMGDDDACGMPDRQPQPPASPAEGDRGSTDKRALAPVFAPKVAGGGGSKAAPRQLLTSVGCASLARSGGRTQFPGPRRKVGGAQPPPPEETTVAPRATRSIRSDVAAFRPHRRPFTGRGCIIVYSAV